jgi:cytochrome b
MAINPSFKPHDGDSTGAQPRRVRVWDLPTRIFHWSLACTVLASIVSAKIGGNAMEWHLRFGHLALALLLFRIVWGFVGGHWSRFASFVFAPSTLMAYLRGDAGPRGVRDVGHSPTGALAVFAMLAVLLLQIATGLVADDEIATTGPLYKHVSSAVSAWGTGWHSGFGQWILIGLIVLHLSAIAYYVGWKRRELVGPMLGGDKHLNVDIPASKDSAGTRALAFVLFACALGAAWWVWTR